MASSTSDSDSASSSDSGSCSSDHRKRKRDHHQKKEAKLKKKREKRKEKKGKESRKKEKKSKKHKRATEGERSIITGKKIKRSAGDVADAEGELRRKALLAHMNDGEGLYWDRGERSKGPRQQPDQQVRLRMRPCESSRHAAYCVETNLMNERAISRV